MTLSIELTALPSLKSKLSDLPRMWDIEIQTSSTLSPSPLQELLAKPNLKQHSNTLTPPQAWYRLPAPTLPHCPAVMNSSLWSPPCMHQTELPRGTTSSNPSPLMTTEFITSRSISGNHSMTGMENWCTMPVSNASLHLASTTQAVLEPVKTLVLRYNMSVVNCVVKLRLVSVSNFYCNAGPNSCNNYSS